MQVKRKKRLESVANITVLVGKAGPFDCNLQDYCVCFKKMQESRETLSLGAGTCWSLTFPTPCSMACGVGENSDVIVEIKRNK